MQRERNNDSGKHENILDPMIDTRDSKVSANSSPARQGSGQATTGGNYGRYQP